MTTERSNLHTLATVGGVDFQESFGWKLPRVYSDVASEYQAAAEGVALHDSSYVGRLKASGDDALDLLNRLSTNLVLRLEPGQGAPTILTTDRGRILDLVVRMVEQYGVKVMVDKKSYIFLVGTVLDFSDGLNGKGFVFENPNAKKACGCGTSFSV